MSNMDQIVLQPSPELDDPGPVRSTGLWVGDTNSAHASNLDAIKENKIHGVLNVALDNYDADFPSKKYLLNFSKVGLCDTGPLPGSTKANSKETVIKAVQAIDQLRALSGSEASQNVLVHCWSGGSRSVMIAALWIAQRLHFEPAPGQTRFATAINIVRKCRGLGWNPSRTHYTPYDPSDPDAKGDGSGDQYPDGKPMAALYYLGQEIDETCTIPIGEGVPPSYVEQGECPNTPLNSH